MSTQDSFIPVEMKSLWTMSDESLGKMDMAFRAWFECNSRLQERAMKFMSSRLAKDTAAVAELRNCKSPMDAFNVQMEYLRSAYADFLDESEKVAGFFSEVANEGLAAGAAERAPAPTARTKHAHHRRSTH